MMRMVRVSNENKEALLKFLKEGTPSSMSINTVNEDKSSENIFSGLTSSTKLTQDKEVIKSKLNEKPTSMEDLLGVNGIKSIEIPVEEILNIVNDVLGIDEEDEEVKDVMDRMLNRSNDNKLKMDGFKVDDEIEEESDLLNIYEIGEYIDRGEVVYSVNGTISIYKKIDGNIVMNTYAPNLELSTELFEIPEYYLIGSDDLNDYHKQNPDAKYMFFIDNMVCDKILSLFDGTEVRTLPEILTYAYINSNNNANIYNQVMGNMVLKVVK